MPLNPRRRRHQRVRRNNRLWLFVITNPITREEEYRGVIPSWDRSPFLDSPLVYRDKVNPPCFCNRLNCHKRHIDGWGQPFIRW